METHPTVQPAAPPAEPTVLPAAPRRRGPGRPIKWIAPADGTPMSSAMKEALYNQEYSRLRYQKNTEVILARQRENYHARVARQREALRQLEAIKSVMGAMPHGA